ncbi:MAG: TldD/PmbA family protein [Sulfolobales archaeon]
MRRVDIEAIYRRAISLGASEAEIYYTYSRDVSLNISDKVERAEVNISGSLGIRVAIGKRVAVVGTQDLSPSGVEEALENAISIARSIPEDPNWRGFNEKLGSSSPTGYMDREVKSVEAEKLAEIASEAIAGVLEAPGGVRPVRGWVSASYVYTEIMNTYGGPISREETAAWIYIYAKASEAGEEGSYGDYRASRSIRDLGARELGRRVGSIASTFTRSQHTRNGVYDLILAPGVFGSFINAMLSPALSALSVQRGRSPLAGRLGRAIAVEGLSIYDEGLEPSLLGSRGFDDEGHPTARTAIVEKGVLKSYLYDSYTAKAENRGSTGNAWRIYSSPPSPGPNHLVIAPGDSSLDEMISITKNGLYVLTTIGEWLSNPVSGNLNATITNAYLIENGEIRGAVNGGVISANFYEVLEKGIALIGREVERRYRVSSPPVLIKGVRVAGE